MDAHGYIEYSADVGGTGVAVYGYWAVPAIGPNTFTTATFPRGKLYVSQSGETGGWSPHPTWTVLES